MDSTRGFLRYWALFLFLVLAYAAVDLGLHPSLEAETAFTLRPDVGRLPDLVHWGGRLLHHGAIGLLVANAIVVSGLAALLFVSALSALRDEPDPRLSTPRTSFPPPG